jgi:deoxyribonuclease V
MFFLSCLMKIRRLHPWNVSYRDAVEIQNALGSRIRIREFTGPVTRVAGVDVSFSRKSKALWGGVVVLGYPDLQRLDQGWAQATADFPYLPGLLSFREMPVLLDVLKGIKVEPDVVFCDGQGIAHPRGLGLAAHMGVLIDKPTIGCAKTRLVGEFTALGPNRGNSSPLTYKGRKVGVVVRTRSGVKPIFVSPGHAITVPQALEMVLNCSVGYRIPEPVRQAHQLVTRIRKRAES